MNDDYDVVEMDFPEYREEQPAIPDVENKSSFSEHKEEIYRRNRLIAAEEQNRLLKEEEREKAVRREKTEELYRDAEEAEAYVFSRKITLPLVILFCISLFAVGTLLIRNSHTAADYAEASAAAETTVLWETTVTEKVTRVTTERTRRETETEITEEETEEISETTTVETTAETTEKIPDEVLKVTVVREPFAEDGSSYIYNTGVMSYRFTAENNGLNEYGVEKITIRISVKNLTDYGYMLIPSFRLKDSDGNYQSCALDHYNKEQTYFSSPFKYADDDEWRDGSPIAFDFDENNLCEISLNAYFDPEADNKYVAFEYDSQRGFPNYTKNADVGFVIPLDEILK